MLTEQLALILLITWPVIPLFWIPVHVFPRFFSRIKFLTYVLPLTTWLPVAFFIYQHRESLLQFQVQFSIFIKGIGFLLLMIGTGIHIWTGKLLSLWGLIGVPEIYKQMNGKLVTHGAFSIVRHPTYIAHTLMFSGVFLVTGVLSTGLLAVLDFILVNLLIIPLEEKELLTRFGDEYKKYKDNVPKFFPRLK